MVADFQFPTFLTNQAGGTGRPQKSKPMKYAFSKSYTCKLCSDTGTIEIFGGTRSCPICTK